MSQVILHSSSTSKTYHGLIDPFNATRDEVVDEYKDKHDNGATDLLVAIASMLDVSSGVFVETWHGPR